MIFIDQIPAVKPNAGLERNVWSKWSLEQQNASALGMAAVYH